MFLTAVCSIIPAMPKTVPKKKIPEYLLGLNPEQLSAVTAGQELLIIAGAGTGKTTVITKRIEYLVKERKLEPDSILALTFTEKAAREMQERLDAQLPLSFNEARVSTFHGFCEQIIRRYALELGVDAGFRVMNEARQRMLIAKVIYGLPLEYFLLRGTHYGNIAAVSRAISAAKDQRMGWEDFARRAE